MVIGDFPRVPGNKSTDTIDEMVECSNKQIIMGFLKLSVFSLVILTATFIAVDQVAGDASNKCALRVVDKSADKAVCVCNATYCDNLVFDWPTKSGEGYLIQSTKSGLRLDVGALDTLQFDWCGMVEHELTVNLEREHQTVLGFGGAFTDASGMHVQAMSAPLKEKLMASYFGQHGAQYDLARVTIAGIDFSTHPYSYDDLTKSEKDFNLSKWSLTDEDLNWKIPLIKRALEMVDARNGSLKLFGSSWSPPAWMKDNESLVRGHLINSKQVYDSYAQYLIRFFNAYKSYGIDFWGATLQNEPRTPTTMPSYSFNSLELGNEQAVEFLAKHLGPALAANGYTKDKFKMMVGDDNLGAINDQVPHIMSHPEVWPYVAGLAFHWYNHESVSYDRLTECYDQIKDHIEFVLMTEACVEPRGGIPVDLGSWDRGERYTSDIIEDLLRHSAGWVDWNMVLDEQGGPNWVNNWVDAPIIINKDNSEFYKQPMYYALTHFSRFFRPNSVRVDVALSEQAATAASQDTVAPVNQVKAVAVHKKDTDHVVVNILNKSDQPKKLVVKVMGVSKVARIQAKSFNTVVLKL